MPIACLDRLGRVMGRSDMLSGKGVDRPVQGVTVGMSDEPGEAAMMADAGR